MKKLQIDLFLNLGGTDKTDPTIKQWGIKTHIILKIKS